jgi:hypothetical protein
VNMWLERVRLVGRVDGFAGKESRGGGTSVNLFAFALGLITGVCG